MRRSLLNKPNLLKSLRQALMLFTLLLLPTTAWGQDPVINIAGDTPDPTTGVISSDNINSGTVTFNSSNNTLTLDNATIAGTVILQSELENLTIHLVGENKIQGAGYGTELGNGIKIADGIKPGALTFTTDDTNPGKLFFPNVTTPIEGFTNIVYKNGLELGAHYDNGATSTTEIGTNVILASIGATLYITKNNPTMTVSGGTITFSEDSGNRILTLSGLNDLDNSIVWHSPTDVTFKIDGTNSIALSSSEESRRLIGNPESNISFSAAGSTATLKFWYKGTPALSLDIPFIGGFKNASNPTLGEGLYQVDLKDVRKDNGYYTDFTEHYITTEAYDLTVKGIRVHNIEGVFIGHKDHILGEKTEGDFDETLKFTPADNSNQTPATLTLNGANIEYAIGNVIVSTLTNPLEVILSGNSNINSGSYLPFEGATGDNANLVFKTLDGDPASLVMTSSGISPTSFYTGFNKVLYPKDDGNQLYAYLSGNNVVIEQVTPYGLTVAGVEVTSANYKDILDGDNAGKVSFTPADNTTTPATPATLTLNGSTITGGIYTTLENLTIDITNTNTISTSTVVNGILSSKNSGTLTFTGSGSLQISSECSVIRGFTAIEGLNLETKTPYEIYNDGYYRLKDKVAVDTTGVKWLKVIQDTTYPLWIAGTQVTENNASHVLGNDNGTISFDGTSTLTLNYASIDYSGTDANPIISSIENLNVKLIGVNEIKIRSLDYYGFKYTGTNGTITFVDPEDYSEIGQLSVYKEGSQITYDNLCSGYNIYNFEQFENGGTNEYFVPENSGWVKINTTSYAKVRYEEVYDLWIGGSRISSNNRNGSGYQEYNPEKHSIVFSEASSSSRIVSNLPELIIELSGNNSLTVTDTTDPAISFTSSDKTPTGKLKFTVGDNSSAVNSMVIDCANGAIVGFSEVITDEPLKLSFPATQPDTWDASTTKVVISDEVFYDLWVGGTQVTSGNASDVTNTIPSSSTAKVVFNAETSTLTLNDGTSIEIEEGGSAVLSGLENLTVKFDGSVYASKGTGVSSFYGFKAQAQEGETRNITFTAATGGSCSIATGAENAVTGFDKVTYNDGVAPYIWSDNFTIAPVTLEKPAFIGTYDEDTGKLLSVRIDCHATRTIDSSSETVNILAYDIVYTIDGGSETAYSDSNPITISGPCTLTAKTIVGNTSSEVATGKYFEPKKDAFTMAIGESLDDLDWCTPSFDAETEYLICKFISESSIFNYDEDSPSEAISTKTSGTGTVDVELSYNDAMVTQILNNIDGALATLTINVGESLSSVFEGSNTYGALYSETAIQVPEGMSAYVITGIDEEKGTVITSPVDFIPANTPVLLEKGDKAIAITHVPYTGTATAPGNNKLKYSNPSSPAKPESTDNWYVIYNNKFVKVTAGTEVKGGKCYLNLNGTAAGTRGFYNIGDGEGTTAIREVKSGEVKGEKLASGEWFDLQGRRLNAKPNKSGLYILNGRKVVIK